MDELDLTAHTVRGPIYFHSQGPLGRRELTLALPKGCEGELVLPASEEPELEKLANAQAGLNRYRLEAGTRVHLKLRSV